MIIDSSVLIAILLREPGADTFSWIIDQSDVLMISAATLFETAMVIQSRKGDGGESELDVLIMESEIEIVPFTKHQASIARRAFHKYGRGRHPAGLNFGDCISYALAKDTGEPLLFKGDDFSQTDIDVVALPADKE